MFRVFVIGYGGKDREQSNGYKKERQAMLDENKNNVYFNQVD